MGADDYIERILKARVYDVASVSPLERMTRLSARLDCEGKPIWLTTEFEAESIYKAFPALHRVGLQEGIERTVGHYRVAA